jgi:hypothetical protein
MTAATPAPRPSNVPGIVPGLQHITCTPQEAMRFISSAKAIGLKFALGPTGTQFVTYLKSSDALALMRQATGASVTQVHILQDEVTNSVYIIAT